MFYIQAPAYGILSIGHHQQQEMATGAQKVVCVSVIVVALLVFAIYALPAFPRVCQWLNRKRRASVLDYEIERYRRAENRRTSTN